MNADMKISTMPPHMVWGQYYCKEKISHGNVSRAITNTECRYVQVEKGMAQNFDSGKY